MFGLEDLLLDLGRVDLGLVSDLLENGQLIGGLGHFGQVLHRLHLLLLLLFGFLADLVLKVRLHDLVDKFLALGDNLVAFLVLEEELHGLLVLLVLVIDRILLQFLGQFLGKGANNAI